MQKGPFKITRSHMCLDEKSTTGNLGNELCEKGKTPDLIVTSGETVESSC